MNTGIRCASVIIFSIGFTANLIAGGSGFNIVVVVNTNSPNSLELGNYYCERRDVPPLNVLRIGWTGGNIVWTKNDFETLLRTPLNAMLASRQLTNQIDYVLLSMDVPYRVTQSGLPSVSGTASTTSCLYYGFKPDGSCPTCPPCCPGCSLPTGSASAYAGSEGIFRQTPPISATSNSWLVMMLTWSNVTQAKVVVDRGVASDFAFPTQTVYLIKSADVARNVRYVLFDDAVFDSRLRNVERVERLDAGFPYDYQLGSQFGLSAFGLPTNLFAPGALADNLTSFGGKLFEPDRMPGPIEYLRAGASASYGTVVEPCNHLGKFPSPRNYFYQARGFSAAECYYQSLTNPYQGILAGEPLAAPFALPCSGAWSNLLSGGVLSGTTNLTIQFNAPDGSRPVQQIDLFMDGLFVRTITNLPPRTNNILYVTINGFPTNYTVLPNSTIKSVASDLAARLNANAPAKVLVSAHGDRIELQSTNPALGGVNIPVSTSNYSASVLTTFIRAERTNFLDTTAFGYRNFFVTNMPGNGTWLQIAVTRTNGSVTTLSATNSSGNTNTAVLVQALMDAINTDPTLTNADGVIAEDLVPVYFVNQNSELFVPAAEFNVRARSFGWAESQVRVVITDSGPLTIIPSGQQRLDGNINDLRPRNHLYVTAGLTNLTLTFPLNTTTNADGYHDLTAVAYEGSHVRPQKRVAQNIYIQNTPLSAVFACLLCDTNTALEATLMFSVVANTNVITKIELFSTGGWLAGVTNQSSGVFSVTATNLGVGRHPFYAVVTRNDGKQYRTETKWIRILDTDSPFPLTISDSAPTVSWPATAGRRYEVLSTTNLTGTFLLRDSTTPTNSAGQWSETNNTAPEQYYRVRSSP